MASSHLVAVLHPSSFAAVGFMVAAAKTSSSSAGTLIFFLLLFALGYFFLIRPQRQKARQRQQVNKDVAVGDKVMLTSGIIGYVSGFVGDHARIEIAPGIVVEVLRHAVAQRIDEVSDVDLALDDDGHPVTGSEDANPYDVAPFGTADHESPDHESPDHDDREYDESDHGDLPHELETEAGADDPGHAEAGADDPGHAEAGADDPGHADDPEHTVQADDTSEEGDGPRKASGAS